MLCPHPCGFGKNTPAFVRCCYRHRVPILAKVWEVKILLADH